jgi:exoribonuclease R
MPKRVVHVSESGLEADGELLRRGVTAIQEELGVTPEFPAEVRAEADASAQAPRLPDLDRTDLPLVTIDPETARDLDQALHIERDGDGYVVHYAIADVAAFVTPGGAVDAEAHRRGETLYGLDAKVPLHPKAISEAAASLLPDGPRPALLWTIRVDGTGEGTEVRVERAMVRSRAKLSYEGVQADLDAGTADPVFGLLREVGERRLAREVARGGVSLPLPDQEVSCVDGRWELSHRQPLPVEQWNAQISLLTGMAAAHLMGEAGVGVLRTLAPADPRDVERLRRVAAGLAVTWPEAESYPDFIRRLDASVAAEAAMLDASTVLLRGSGYVTFTDGLPEVRVHAALASTYSHVTAPLRRLVDRYAGEVCVALSSGEPVPAWVLDRFEELPDTMRESSRRANAYERAVLDLVEAALLRDRVGEEFAAMVVDVDDRKPERGDVVVRDPAVEAPVVGRAPLPLGADVTVRLTTADPVARRVEFALERTAADG